MHRAAKPADKRGGGTAAAGLLACVAAIACLSACAPRPQDIETASIAARQPLEKAMVDMPPGGPAIVGVIERNYTNSTTQEIILSNRSRTQNQNFLTVTMFGPVKVRTGPENQLPNDPLALMNAGQEMRWYFPGVKMSVSSLYAQNRYGAFGYATGRSSLSDNCLYAWQRIRAPDHDSTMISNQGTISVRLRYCDPVMTDTDLLNIMAGFNINAYFLAPGWNPFGPAPAPPDALGKPGATVLPTASVPADSTAFTGSVEPVTRPVKRAAVVPAVEAEPDYVVPAVPATRVEGYAVVPPP